MRLYIIDTVQRDYKLQFQPQAGTIVKLVKNVYLAWVFLTVTALPAMRGCLKSPLLGSKTFSIPLNPRQLLMGETPKTALAPLKKGDFDSSSPLFKGG
jgi:hypothetical protein